MASLAAPPGVGAARTARNPCHVASFLSAGPWVRLGGPWVSTPVMRLSEALRPCPGTESGSTLLGSPAPLFLAGAWSALCFGSGRPVSFARACQLGNNTMAAPTTPRGALTKPRWALGRIGLVISPQSPGRSRRCCLRGQVGLTKGLMHWSCPRQKRVGCY